MRVQWVGAKELDRIKVAKGLLNRATVTRFARLMFAYLCDAAAAGVGRTAKSFPTDTGHNATREFALKWQLPANPLPPPLPVPVPLPLPSCQWRPHCFCCCLNFGRCFDSSPLQPHRLAPFAFPSLPVRISHCATITESLHFISGKNNLSENKQQSWHCHR